MKAEILRPLRVPAYRRAWAGQALSSLGDGVFPVILSVAVLRHRPAVDLGYVLGSESVMMVAAALFGGVLADRIRRSRAMIAADAVRMAAVVGLALGAARAPLAVPMILAAVIGLGSGLFRPASQAIMPDLAGDALTQANALRSLTTRIGFIAGPVLGAVLLGVAGASAGFWFDAATFAVSILSLLGLKDARPERAAESSVFAEARAGVGAVLRRPWVATIIGQGTLQLIGVMAPALVLLPIYLKAHSELSAYGGMLALQAAGSACGGLAVGSRTPRHPGAVGVLGLGLLSGQLVCMLAGAPIALLGVAMFFTGLGYAAFGVLWAAGLQRAIPGDMLGRVFAVDMLGTYALEPVGLSAAPVLAGYLGLHSVLTIGLVVLAVTTIVPLFVPGVRDFADPDPSVPQPSAPSAMVTL